MAKGTQQHVLRVALQAGHVDIAGCLAVALPAGRILVGALQNVELEFGTSDRPHAQLGELLNHPLQHHAWTFLRRRAIRVVYIGNDVRDAGLPRHQVNRAEVGEGKHVGQPSIQPALDIDDIAHRVVP